MDEIPHRPSDNSADHHMVLIRDENEPFPASTYERLRAMVSHAQRSPTIDPGVLDEDVLAYLKEVYQREEAHLKRTIRGLSTRVHLQIRVDTLSKQDSLVSVFASFYADDRTLRSRCLGIRLLRDEATPKELSEVVYNILEEEYGCTHKLGCILACSNNVLNAMSNDLLPKIRATGYSRKFYEFPSPDERPLPCLSRFLDGLKLIFVCYLYTSADIYHSTEGVQAHQSPLHERQNSNGSNATSTESDGEGLECSLMEPIEKLRNALTDVAGNPYVLALLEAQLGSLKFLDPTTGTNPWKLMLEYVCQPNARKFITIAHQYSRKWATQGSSKDQMTSGDWSYCIWVREWIQQFEEIQYQMMQPTGSIAHVL